MLGILKAWTWAAAVVSSSPATQTPFKLGSGFGLAINENSNHLAVNHANQPFLSASARADQAIGSSANFKINEVDRSKRTDQHTAHIAH